MTNKPTLSVERELLERITRPQLKRRDETVRRRAIAELRALLDKPDHPCQVQLDGCDGSCASTAQHQPAPVAFVIDIESAAKKLAQCMDYPWEYMPEQGRQSMREHAKAVVEASRLNGVKP